VIDLGTGSDGELALLSEAEKRELAREKLDMEMLWDEFHQSQQRKARLYHNNKKEKKCFVFR